MTDQIISQSEFGQALNAAGATECPACGGTEFMGMGLGGEVEVLYLLSRRQINAGALEGYSVLPLYCAKCGFVRLHDPRPLGLVE